MTDTSTASSPRSEGPAFWAATHRGLARAVKCTDLTACQWRIYLYILSRTSHAYQYRFVALSAAQIARATAITCHGEPHRGSAQRELRYLVDTGRIEKGESMYLAELRCHVATYRAVWPPPALSERAEPATEDSRTPIEAAIRPIVREHWTSAIACSDSALAMGYAVAEATDLDVKRVLGICLYAVARSKRKPPIADPVTFLARILRDPQYPLPETVHDRVRVLLSGRVACQP